MNDKELQQAVQQAFDEIVLPDDVRNSAFRRVDETRSQLSQSEFMPDGGKSGAESPNNVIPFRPEPRSAANEAQAAPLVRAIAPKRRKRFKAPIAAAACLLAVVLAFGGVKAYATPVAYVGIDAEPSVELKLNQFDIVVAADPINEEGAALLDSVNVVGKGYDDALNVLQESSVSNGYSNEDTFVSISVTADDADQAERITGSSNRYLEGCGCAGSCSTANAEEREAAQAAGVGVGRYEAEKALMEADPSRSEEECRDMSMKEIREALQAEVSDAAESKGSSSAGNGSAQKGQQTNHGNQGTHHDD